MRGAFPLLTYFVLGLAATHSAFAFAINPGSTREEVVKAYGFPRSTARLGDREILTYDEGSVTLKEGLVQEYRFPKHEPKLQAPAKLIAPQAAPKPAPPTTQLEVALQRVQPRQPLPAPALIPYTPPPAPSPFSVLIWPFVMLGIAGVMKVVLNNYVRRRRPDFAQQVRTPVAPARASEPMASVSIPRNNGSADKPSITRLTRENLSRLEWRRFEELVHGYYEKTGLRAQRSRVGADGGIDIFLYKPGEGRPLACVQCKAWSSAPVGVKPVRELFGVMAADGIQEGRFVTTSRFTSEAKAFAEGKPMTLIDADLLIEHFAKLSADDHTAVVQQAFRDDYETPTCPRCDVKMVMREAEKPFWGCRNYPRCRQTFTCKAVEV